MDYMHRVRKTLIILFKLHKLKIAIKIIHKIVIQKVFKYVFKNKIIIIINIEKQF